MQEKLKTAFEKVSKGIEEIESVLREIKEKKRILEGYLFKAVHFCPICGNPIDSVKNRVKTPLDSSRMWRCPICNTIFAVRLISSKSLLETMEGGD